MAAKIIGSGHDGKVIRVSRTSGDVAIKYIPLKAGKGLRSIMEIAIMTHAKKHPNVNLMTYNRVVIDSKSVQIEMNVALGTLHGRPLRTLEEKRLCFDSLCKAVIFLHRHDIVHGDIKPANVLLFPNSYKLSDFGHSTLPEGRIKYGGTSSYLAPEVWDGKGYHRPADLWAFGCTVHYIWNECALFPSQSKEDDYRKAIDIWFGRAEPRLRIKGATRDRKCAPTYLDDFVNSLTEYEPDKRVDVESNLSPECLTGLPPRRSPAIRAYDEDPTFEFQWRSHTLEKALRVTTRELWERSRDCPINNSDRLLACYSLACKIHHSKSHKSLTLSSEYEESVLRCLGYDILGSFFPDSNPASSE